MRRPKLSLGDLLAAAKKNTASSRSRIDPQQQLDDARREAQKALAEWRSYETQYYEEAWLGAVAKVRRLVH